MPLTLNVGLTKKVGLPDYGSLGASCHVAVELDNGLLQHDLDGFQQQVRRAYTACRQAVHDQLARELGGDDDVDAPGEQTAARTRSAAKTNGRAASNGRSGTSSRSAGTRTSTTNGHRATSKQLDYARQLADQIDGLGVRKLGSLADQLYQKPLADLSSLEASGLIDVLKQLKSGDIDLADALAGAAA